jgi:adenylate cyclase
MALYGLASADGRAGARDALRGAAEMLKRLERINQHLASELPHPLRMGIGIHSGEAIVGTMGPPAAQQLNALGDTVNTAARLESLTKDHGCPIILSRRAADLAGLDLGPAPPLSITVKGKTKPVEFHALEAVPEIAAPRPLAGCTPARHERRTD